VTGVDFIASDAQVAQSRRHSPRVDVAEQLRALALETNTPLTVMNIGMGGFAVESMTAFRQGDHHTVRFTRDDVLSVTLPATVRHCRQTTSQDGTPLFLAGFEFDHDVAGDTEDAVAMLLDIATSVLTFQ
jgi:hypothetical protein